jgi:hypothetical protein
MLELLCKPASLFGRAIRPMLCAVLFVSAATVCTSPILFPVGALAQDSGGAKAKEKKAADDKSKAKKPVAPPDGGDPSNGGDESGSSTGDDPGAGKKKATTGAGAKSLSIDDEYVHENLEAYLHPSTIQWLDDGRVKMVFDLSQRNEDHESAFTPKIAKDQINSMFRWTVRGEHGWYGGTYSGSSKSGDTDYYYGGLKTSMEGQAVVNCWFTDDVEAEVSYSQFVSHNAKQMWALVFTNKDTKSIGNNFGTQAATFTKTRLEKTKGTVDQVLNENGMRFKLLVKDGNFEVLRDGKSKQKQTYSKTSFASGRIGFVWGGGISSIVHRLEITGRVDAKKMAAELRKSGKK